MRGELPLPKDAKPWTRYAALLPTRGNTTGNTDGLSATCEPADKRGWERRFEHSIIIFDGQGNLIDEWEDKDELFKKLPCGRGPHQIKISPYDKEKHVWIFDDQLHVIYKFTYDGKLVLTHGQLGVRGRGPNTFDCPTDIAWLPDGTYFITDGYGGTRVAKFDANDKFIMDWAGRPRIRRTRARTSGTPSTASRSAPTAGSSSWTADTSACRSSTRTASSSTCGRSDRPTGRPIRRR